MPVDDANTDGGTPDAPDAEESKDSQGSGDSSSREETHVPLAAHTALRAKNQKLEAAIAKNKADADAATLKAAEAAGEFKSLYEEAKPKLARFEQFESATKERNSTRVDALPDEWKPVVPKGLDPLDLSSWLDELEPKVKGQEQKEEKDETRPAGTRSGSGTGEADNRPIPAAAKADADKAGMTPEAWWAIMRNSKRYAAP